MKLAKERSKIIIYMENLIKEKDKFCIMSVCNTHHIDQIAFSSCFYLSTSSLCCKSFMKLAKEMSNIILYMEYLIEFISKNKFCIISVCNKTILTKLFVFSIFLRQLFMTIKKNSVS